MDRFIYHFFRTGTNDNSPLLIIIGIALLIGYFIYKNWGKISAFHSEIKPSNINVSLSEDKQLETVSNNLFSDNEIMLFSDVYYKYRSLVEQGVTGDRENYAGIIAICLNNINDLSSADLQKLDYCYESIMMVYVQLSSLLTETGKMTESVAMIDIAKQAAQCCDLIRKKTGITDTKD